jgi:hypothetical protein
MPYVIWLMSSRRRSKLYGLTLVCEHCASKIYQCGLSDLPHIPRRMPVQCISLYHSLFVVLLWCADQHMHVQSFHLCPVQITVGLNTSIECCCQIWLSQQSKIKKNIYGSDFGEEFCTKCLLFILLLSFKNLQFFILAHLYILEIYVRVLHFGIREKFIWVKYSHYFLLSVLHTII